MLCLRSLRKWLHLVLMTILFLIILTSHCNLHANVFTAVRPLLFASTMMYCVLSTIIAVCFYFFSTYQPPSIQSTTAWQTAFQIWNSWKSTSVVWVLPFLSLLVRCHWSWEISITQLKQRCDPRFRVKPSTLPLYTSPVADIFRRHNMTFHLFADGIQLYIFFPCNDDIGLACSMVNIQECLKDIDLCMTTNKLKLNKDKTELIYFYSKHRPQNSFPPPYFILYFMG